MKVSVVALSVLLVMAFSSLASSVPRGSSTPTTCCFNFITKQIHKANVTSYYRTSSLCSQPAVVFQTVGKPEGFCANFNDHWVQKYWHNPLPSWKKLDQ